MVDIYSGGPSLLPDAPLVHKRSNDDLGWRRPKRKMSPARLPDDLRDEIDGFAGARATIATDRALPRAKFPHFPIYIYIYMCLVGICDMSVYA